MKIHFLDKYIQAPLLLCLLSTLGLGNAQACEKHQNTQPKSSSTAPQNASQPNAKGSEASQSESRDDQAMNESVFILAQADDNTVIENKKQESATDKSDKQNKTITMVESQKSETQKEGLADKTSEETPKKSGEMVAEKDTDTSNIEVVEFVLANAVESREPKTVEAFSKEDQRGFAFARVHVKSDTDVTFVWTRDGHEVNRTTLPVHMAKKWRTYSSIKLRPGQWKVQLLANNQVLSEKTFNIE